MRKGLKILLASMAGTVVVLAVVGVALWYFVWRSDAPPEVSLASAVNSLANASPSATPVPGRPGGPGGPGGRGGDAPQGGGGDFGVQAAPSVAAPSLPASGGSRAGSVAGNWAPDSARQSFVGYRVDEELRGIGSNTVVGRTSGVTGTAVLTDNSLTSAKFVADVTTLKSDNGLRDGQLRNQGIEFQKFPNATFELSGPVALPPGLVSGQPITVTLKGKFTLHGVTRDVSVAAQAQMVNNNLVVVGTLPITFTDYQIAKPRGGPVLSLADTAVMELQIILTRS